MDSVWDRESEALREGISHEPVIWGWSLGMTWDGGIDVTDTKGHFKNAQVE